MKYNSRKHINLYLHIDLICIIIIIIIYDHQILILSNIYQKFYPVNNAHDSKC